MTETHSLILVTNDDGIGSPGLRAAAQAVMGLGDLLVAAPCRQWSGAGRCLPADSTGIIHPHPLIVDGQEVKCFCVDGTPAQVILHAVLELAPRRPDLLVVGVNYGENLGADVTISGTVGAALQGAAMGIPSLAVSLQTPKETHTNPSDDVDFTAAIHFTRTFARRLLKVSLPFDVDVLKIDIPDDATPRTPWRLTRVSRHTYFYPLPPRRDDWSRPAQVDYEARWDPDALEPDSDIYAVAVDRVVSVAPLSIDLTSRADPGEVEALLRGPTDL
ncbi:MAG TPA: 5'/3'-nucleotidase SurE [Anaerolineales bacterium]|nr:5'/3'-nucleotidase SurE [Anaerolineales bacterium]